MLAAIPPSGENMTDQLMRLPEVIHSVKKSRASIYAAIRYGAFPAPILIGKRSVAWRQSDIQVWLDTRPQSTAAYQPDT